MIIGDRTIISPDCPAVNGLGVDLNTADFELRVRECGKGPEGETTTTEVYGVYVPKGAIEEERDNNFEIEGLKVPKDSPIANIARQIATEPSGEMQQRVGAIMRVGVAACLCCDVEACPAFNQLRFLGALERAVN